MQPAVSKYTMVNFRFSLLKEEFDSVASHSIIIIGTSRWINQRRINIEIGRYKMKRFREPLYVK